MLVAIMAVAPEVRELELLWRRFAMHDPVVLGVAAACALVVSADERVVPLEMLKFAHVFQDAKRRHPGGAPIADDAFGRMATDFQDLATMFVRHPAVAKPQAQALLRKFVGDAARSETIVLAAKASVTADGSTDPREQSALAEVVRALGLRT